MDRFDLLYWGYAFKKPCKSTNSDRTQGTRDSMTISGLLELPTEILQTIFAEVPNELRQTCRSFVVMYNDHYMNLFIERFGYDAMKRVALYDTSHLIRYIKSFDYWRKDLRMIVSRNYNLPEIGDIEGKTDILDILNCQYIRDSWKLIYGIYMNRRIFVDYDDYKINDLHSDHVTHSVRVDKSINLVPGLYNLSAGVIIKGFRGLNSTRFKVVDVTSGETLLEYQPATNFGELVPHNKFVLLDLGSFQISKTVGKIDQITELEETEDDCDEREVVCVELEKEQYENKLVNVRLIVEESNILVKSSSILCYVDINAYQLKDCVTDPVSGSISCKFEKYWLAWWIENQAPKPETIVNILLKELYSSIELSINRNETEDEKPASSIEINEKIDVESYNKRFYSKFNESGEPIERIFKFRTQRDRKRYEEWIGNTIRNGDEEKILDNEPLKWKLSTILEL